MKQKFFFLIIVIYFFLIFPGRMHWSGWRDQLALRRHREAPGVAPDHFPDQRIAAQRVDCPLHGHGYWCGDAQKGKYSTFQKGIELTMPNLSDRTQNLSENNRKNQWIELALRNLPNRTGKREKIRRGIELSLNNLLSPGMFRIFKTILRTKNGPARSKILENLI